MTVNKIGFEPYKIRFHQPLKTSASVWEFRRGWIVKVHSDGLTGLGEAAPLPGFSPESFEDCGVILTEISESVQPGGQDTPSILEILDQFTHRSPAAVFGVETALYDLQAKKERILLSKWLNPHAETSVKVNALYTGQSQLPPGVKTVKVKLMAQSLKSDLSLINAVIDRFGDQVLLRLDVNGGWNFRQAVETCRALESYPVDYIEQPLPVHAVYEMAELRHSTTIPIAADESLTDLASAARLIEAEATDVFILKPTVSGGFAASGGIIRLAEEAGIRVVITSSLESTVGRLALLHLTAAYKITEPCGLLTDLFEDDFTRFFPEVKDGKISLPRMPGLGIEHDRF